MNTLPIVLINQYYQEILHLELAGEVKAVDGELTLLWHNETVSECNEWKGWRSVYEQVFERVC